MWALLINGLSPNERRSYNGILEGAPTVWVVAEQGTHTHLTVTNDWGDPLYPSRQAFFGTELSMKVTESDRTYQDWEGNSEYMGVSTQGKKRAQPQHVRAGTPKMIGTSGDSAQCA